MLIHMGEMVERVFREKEAKDPVWNVTRLAERLNCDRRNVYDICPAQGFSRDTNTNNQQWHL